MSANFDALLSSFLGAAGSGYIEGRKNKEEKNRLAAEALLKKQQQDFENQLTQEQIAEDMRKNTAFKTQAVIDPDKPDKPILYSTGGPTLQQQEKMARLSLPGMMGPLGKEAYELPKPPEGTTYLGPGEMDLKVMTRERKPYSRLQLKGRTTEGKPVSYDPTEGVYLADGAIYEGKVLPPADKPLDAVTMKSLRDQKSAIQLLQDAEKTPEDVQKRSTGLWGGVGAPMAAKVPLLGRPFRDADRATFQSNVGLGLLKFTYSEAGKQLSDPEREAIKEAVDSVDQPYEVFKPKLENAIRIINRAQEDYLRGLDEGGFIVPTAFKTTVQTKGNAKPKTVVQNGHTYTLNEATGEYE